MDSRKEAKKKRELIRLIYHAVMHLAPISNGVIDVHRIQHEISNSFGIIRRVNSINASLPTVKQMLETVGLTNINLTN